MPLTETEAAYLAGFFDGEGCINFTRAGKQKTWVIRVAIRNTDLSVIKYIQSIAGGRIETRTAYPGKPTWKASHCLRWDWDHAIAFLEAIEPWVRIKKEQILVAKMWDALRNRGNARPDEQYRDMILLLVSQLQWLNRKGKRREGDKEPIAETLA